MAARRFLVLFSHEFECPFSEYQQRAFRELLYWHARPIAGLIRKLRPGFFADDFNFIHYLGETTNLREVKATAAEFRDTNVARQNFWRTRLKIRVSGRLATRLAHDLFSKASRNLEHDSGGSARKPRG